MYGIIYIYIFWVTPACVWCCDASTFSDHENHQTSNLNIKYYNKGQCPDHRQTFAANNCVCVCFLPIYSGRQIRWKYQPGSHRISYPPSFCGTCLYFSREKDSDVPFPRRPLSRIEKKFQLPGFEVTSQRVRRLRGYQLSYRENKGKKKRKRTIEKKEKKKRKNTRRLLTQRLCSCATLN